MADKEHLKIIQQGVKAWNIWRNKNPKIRPNLSNADLQGMQLKGVNFKDTDLTNVDFCPSMVLTDKELVIGDFKLGRTIETQCTDISRSNICNANLNGARLDETNLSHSNLEAACLRNISLCSAQLIKCNLSKASLIEADLSNADLSNANLSEADLRGAVLQNTNFTNADISYITVGLSIQIPVTNILYPKCTIFSKTNLSNVKNIEFCNYQGPSSIDFDTIIKSTKLPQTFLKGCGLPDELIDYILSISNKTIQFYSCFISYSSKDDKFAQRIYTDLQREGIRCWFTPKDMKIGDKIRIRLDQAIDLYDKLVLILSEHSINSQWVEQEVETALEKERKLNIKKIVPLRIDEEIMKIENGWGNFIRNSRNIGDFTHWENNDKYKESFDQLLTSLKS